MKMNKSDKGERALSIKRILEAIVINIGFFLFITLFYDEMFEAADDSIMSTILYGGYGYLTPYNVFQNLFLTKVMVKLIAWFPGVAWYSLVQTGTVFLAMTVITYLVLEQNCKKLRTIMWMVCLAFLWYECYAKMQFTKTAAVASIAGIMMVYRLCKGEQCNKFWTSFWAIVLCVLGMMWRSAAFGMVFIVLFIVGLVDLFNHAKNDLGKKILIYVVASLVLGGTYLGVQNYHESSYMKEPAWEYFFQFNALRAELVDCGWPDYDRNQQLYNSLGMTEEDIDLYDRWNYGDPEKFTFEALRQLNEAKVEQKASFAEEVARFLPQIFRHLMECNIWIIYVSVAIISLCLQPKRSKVYIAYGILATIGLEFYFLYIGRGMLNRLDVGILGANLVILSLLPWDEKREQKVFYPVIVAIMCMALIKFPVMEKNLDYLWKQGAQKDVMLMNSDRQSIYYAEEFTVDDYEKATTGLWDCPQFGIYSNISRLGGWKYPSPDALGVSSKYGISNPYRQMIDNPNVYLVCNNTTLVDKIENYIKRNYDEGAYAVLSKKLNESNVYQIVTGGPKIDAKSAEKNDLVKGQIVSVESNDNGSIRIEGQVSGQDMNMFAQKFYLEITDSRTGKSTMNYVTQYFDDSEENDAQNSVVRFSKNTARYSKKDIKYLKYKAYVLSDGQLYVIEL